MQDGIDDAPRSYAAAVRQGRGRSSGPNETSAVATPTAVAGNWTPRERQMLLATLGKDWSARGELAEPVETARLRTVALEVSPVHQDDALRTRTEDETKALLAYLNGELELPHAPNFIKATMPVLQRAMIEQYHESHIEATLTAGVPPRAKLRRSMTTFTLFAQLYEGNADTARGRQMIDKMMDDVKLIYFDGTHTLKFVFHSHRIANDYLGLAFRLHGVCLELEDTERRHTAGTFRQAQLNRQYAIRVYGTSSIGLVALLAAMGQLPGVHIVDAERPRLEATDKIDTRFVVIRFLGTDCPEALRGVTKLTMAGQVLTLHHHLTQQRLPCARCFVPYHTTGFCRATPAQLAKMQLKHQRVYTGPVPGYKVGEAVLYKHSDGDSLKNFLDTLQGEIQTELAVATGDESKANLRAPAPKTNVGTATVAQTSDRPPRVQEAEPSTPSPGSDSEGFILVRTKAHRHKQVTPALKQEEQHHESTLPTLAPGSEGAVAVKAVLPRVTTAAHTARLSRTKVRGKGKTRAGRGGSTTSTSVPAFNRFTRARDQGRFAALGAEEGDSDEAPDEAPYAYPCTMEEQTDSDGQAGRASSPRLNGVRTDTDQGDEAGSNIVVEDMECDAASDNSGYVGSSIPSQSPSPAPTPGSEFPYSLDSDFNDHPAGVTEVRTSPSSASDDKDQDTTRLLSQDGFVLEKTERAPGMPQQLPVFLMPFNGSLIKVPANGQCAYAALHATTSYVEGGELMFTSDVVRNVNVIKRSVYTLMMSNLAKDVECGVVDPSRDLKRLYPQHPTPLDVAGATATLFAHYAQERARSVNTQIPTAFWAGAEVLRAMAQYLREPLFVLDVAANNDTHVQRYYYQEYELKNGEQHESGCGGAIDDATAKDMFAHFEKLHVLPVCLVLKKHEGHFYGVHNGDMSAHWHAEGDRQFAMENCGSHPWISEVIAHIDYSSSRLAHVDALTDTAAVNTILIGGMEHRRRLDVVHDRLHLPRLDGDGYDMAHLEASLSAEGDRLQQAAGPDTIVESRYTDTDGVGSDGTNLPRHPITTSGRVAQPALCRILNSKRLDPELMADRSKLRQLIKENAAAVEEWCRHGPRAVRPPTQSSGAPTILGLMPWLLEHRHALHSIFRYLPFPEVAAKMLPTETLMMRGALEAYDSTINQLRGILTDPNTPKKAAEFCRTWLTACTTNGGNKLERTIAADGQRWERLIQQAPNFCNGARPADISPDCWTVLHTLPHTVWVWAATPMGKAPAGHLDHYYRGHPVVQQLCEQVARNGEWGLAVEIPSGLTWTDRLDSMEAGQSVTTRC